jgi:K+-transporting ATPase ATPase C chain
VGSELDGQAFTKPQYFHPRPSATSPAYNPEYSTFANLGPTSSALSDQVKKELATVLKTERPYNPGLTAKGVPVDAVTTSGSGLDPDISPAAAYFQVPRVARARGISEERLYELLAAQLQPRTFGILGEPRVTVLELNLALDQTAGH